MATRITNTDLDLLGTGQVTNLRKANAAGQALRYQDLLTESATAPSTPIPGEMWYDTDVTSKRLATYTADGWVNTSRKHRYDYSLADFQDETDPVQAALTAMAADHAAVGTFPGDWWWGTPDTAIQFVLNVPPGKWGTATTAYSIGHPLAIVGPSRSAGQDSPGASLSGDFTITTDAGEPASVQFSDLILEGLHTLGTTTSNGNVRFTDCFLTDDTTYTGRAGWLINVVRMANVEMVGCFAYTSLAGILSVASTSTTNLLRLADCDLSCSGNIAVSLGAGTWNRRLVVRDCYLSALVTAVEVSRSIPEVQFRGNTVDSGVRALVYAPTATAGNETFAIDGVRVQNGPASGPAFSFDYSSSTSTNAAPHSVSVTGSRIGGTERAVYINTKGTGTAGTDIQSIVIDGNSLQARSAAGVSVEINGSALSNSTHVAITNNQIRAGVAGTAPVLVNNHGSVHVRGNTVTTASAAEAAIAVTNNGRVIVAENITRGGTVTDTGNTASLVMNNI